MDTLNSKDYDNSIMNEVLKIIKDSKNSYTFEELYNLGLRDSHFKVLTEKKLIKYENGKFTIVLNHNQDLFRQFMADIYSSNYEEAYNDLVNCYNAQITHDYDDHTRMYFMLLEEILGSDYHFKKLDNIYYFELKYNNTYFDYFIKAKEAIYDKQYNKAIKYLIKYMNEEAKHKGKTTSSSKLLFALLKEIDARQIEKRQKEKIIAKNNRIPQDEYNKFMNALQSKNFIEAKKKLEDFITFKDDYNRTYIFRIYLKLIDCIINLSNKGSLEPKQIDYSNCSTPYDILMSSIMQEDFLTSIDIFKSIELNKNYLIYIKYLLTEIKILNRTTEDIASRKEQLHRINSDIYTAFKAKDYPNLIEAYKRKRDFSYPKYRNSIQNIIDLLEYYLNMLNDDTITLPKCNYDYAKLQGEALIDRALTLKDYKTIFSNTYNTEYKDIYMQVISDTAFNIIKLNKQREQQKETSKDDSTYKYLDEEKYTELSKMLRYKNNLTTFDQYIKVLLSILEQNTIKENTKDYIISSEINLNSLYEAIDRRCYREALRQAYIIRNNNMDKHINYYIKLLEEIIKKIDKAKIKQEITNINNNMSNMLHRNNISMGIINKLEEALGYELNIINNNGLNPDFTYYLYDLVNTIELCLNNNIDDSYFNVFTYDDNKEKNFIESLHNGDYITSLNIIKDSNFNKDFPNIPFSYLLLYKRLLLIIEQLVLVRDKYNIVTEEIKENNLTIFRRAIKNNRYNEAFDLYINSDIFSDIEDENDIAGILAYLKINDHTDKTNKIKS